MINKKMITLIGIAALMASIVTMNTQSASLGIVQQAEASNNAAILETGQTSENIVWITGIVLLIIFAIAIFIAAIWKLTHRRKKRQYFSTDVKREVLRDQDHKCTTCKKSAGVWDYDHTDGDRSNNDISNCQALCPNCHAKKTRGLLKVEIKSASKWRTLKISVIVVIVLGILATIYPS